MRKTIVVMDLTGHDTLLVGMATCKAASAAIYIQLVEFGNEELKRNIPYQVISYSTKGRPSERGDVEGLAVHHEYEGMAVTHAIGPNVSQGHPVGGTDEETVESWRSNIMSNTLFEALTIVARDDQADDRHYRLLLTVFRWDCLLETTTGMC